MSETKPCKGTKVREGKQNKKGEKRCVKPCEELKHPEKVDRCKFDLDQLGVKLRFKRDVNSINEDDLLNYWKDLEQKHDRLSLGRIGLYEEYSGQRMTLDEWYKKDKDLQRARSILYDEEMKVLSILWSKFKNDPFSELAQFEVFGPRNPREEPGPGANIVVGDRSFLRHTAV